MKLRLPKDIMLIIRRVLTNKHRKECNCEYKRCYFFVVDFLMNRQYVKYKNTFIIFNYRELKYRLLSGEYIWNIKHTIYSVPSNKIPKNY